VGTARASAPEIRRALRNATHAALIDIPLPSRRRRGLYHALGRPGRDELVKGSPRISAEKRRIGFKRVVVSRSATKLK
jgi:hypothetical protein